MPVTPHDEFLRNLQRAHTRARGVQNSAPKSAVDEMVKATTPRPLSTEGLRFKTLEEVQTRLEAVEKVLGMSANGPPPPAKYAVGDWVFTGHGGYDEVTVRVIKHIQGGRFVLERPSDGDMKCVTGKAILGLAPRPLTRWQRFWAWAVGA